jgi:hypothetical protein
MKESLKRLLAGTVILGSALIATCDARMREP